MESGQEIEGQDIYYMHKCSVWLKLAVMGIDPEALYTHKAKPADWDLLASKLGLTRKGPSPSIASPGLPKLIISASSSGEVVQPETVDKPCPNLLTKKSVDTFQIGVLESEELEISKLFYEQKLEILPSGWDHIKVASPSLGEDNNKVVQRDQSWRKESPEVIQNVDLSGSIVTKDSERVLGFGNYSEISGKVYYETLGKVCSD